MSCSWVLTICASEAIGPGTRAPSACADDAVFSRHQEQWGGPRVRLAGLMWLGAEVAGGESVFAPNSAMRIKAGEATGSGGTGACPCRAQNGHCEDMSGFDGAVGGASGRATRLSPPVLHIATQVGPRVCMTSKARAHAGAVALTKLMNSASQTKRLRCFRNQFMGCVFVCAAPCACGPSGSAASGSCCRAS